ncbi:MAG: CDP-alcohol phosphatidyltransferase family protein [Marinomonas sp.]
MDWAGYVLMLDAKIRPVIDPPLNAIGGALARAGITANMLTFVGLAIGLGGAVAIALGQFALGFALILANRLLDGLDGAVARAKGPTQLGGYFDIVADFAFYVSVPVGFGIVSAQNTLAALVLTASFVLTGVSFLAFAVIAAQRGEETSAHGKKSFFYSTGLAEGTETVVVLSAMALFPAYFVPLAYGFAGLCVLTVFQRSVMAAAQFKG